jgi:hypothetical protein
MNEKTKREREEASNHCGHSNNPNEFGVDSSSSMPCVDFLPNESRVLYDSNHPVMAVGCMYPSMAEFRLAMRQYAIEKEFELGIEASTPKKYRGFCRGGDCPWSIHARIERDGSPTIIVRFCQSFNFVEVFLCLSSNVHFIYTSVGDCDE